MASQSKQLDRLACCIKQEVHSNNEIETDMKHCELFEYHIQPKSEQSYDQTNASTEDDIFEPAIFVEEANAIKLEPEEVKQEEVVEEEASPSTSCLLDNPVTRPFQCLLCLKRFTLRSTLRKHVYIHSGVKPFQCDICNRTFNRRSNLTKHVRTHTGEKLYECEICRKRFSETGTLKRHQTTHSNNNNNSNTNNTKPFACDTCGVRFAHLRNLKTHVRVHDGGGGTRFTCAQCGRAFSQRAHLEAHVAAVHTGERPHRCSLCSRAFSDSGQLSKHRKTHGEEGGRVWRCKETGCAAAFQQRWALQRHGMVHTGERPYQCALCKRRFADSSKLNRHDCKPK